MSYKDQLSPWCIIRLLPDLQRITVARFRRRSQAEECLKTLQRMNPTCHYQIIFDPPEPSSLLPEIDRIPNTPCPEFNLSLRLHFPVDRTDAQ